MRMEREQGKKTMWQNEQDKPAEVSTHRSMQTESPATDGANGLFKGISSFFKWLLGIVLLCLFILVGMLIYFNKGPIKSLYNYLTSSQTEIGHIQISDLSSTTKLKLFSMYKEVVVSQYRTEKGRFYGDHEYQIHTIYPGRVDVGFDLSKCDDDWIVMRGDTAFVTMPSVEILNQDQWFIDEASKKTPIESGSWSADYLNTFARRANAMIKRACELDNCYKLAEEQGYRVIQNLIQSLGVKHVRVSIHSRKNYKPYALSGDDRERIQNEGHFYVSPNGSPYIKYDNGAALFYKGEITDEELLSCIDWCNYETYYNMTSHFWNVYRKGNYASIAFMNLNLLKGDAATAGYLKIWKKKDSLEIRKIAESIFHASHISIAEVDREGKVLFRY